MTELDWQTLKTKKPATYGGSTECLYRRLVALPFLFLLITQTVSSQVVLSQDSMKQKMSMTKKDTPSKFVRLAIPSAMVCVGIIGLESDWLKYQNLEIKEELQENIDHRLTLDDFTQYAPMLSTYGLDLIGIKSKHHVLDKTIILGTAYAIMGMSVNSLKQITRVERPDGSSRNSFPSGHTATAFMGAELLRREYWDVSPWIGITGYAVATGTGFFRMYNNRHWFTDVLAGAGIGILSVEAACCLYPTISKTLFRKRFKKDIQLLPYTTGIDQGITLRFTF